jgi:hypothetical protein
MMSKDEEKKRMGTTQQTLVDISHPLFEKGYREGRLNYFREQCVLTDDEVVTCLGFAFEPIEQEDAEEREESLYYSIGQIMGEMSGCVIPRQPRKGRTRGLQKVRRKSPARQTLVDISHPLFRKGYQEGRQRYFREPCVLSDERLVQCIGFAFEQPSEQEHAEEREDSLYYSMGQLVGEMSGRVLPRQPHEERKQELQEAFLARIVRKYAETGPALAKTIRQFWVVQDQLAQTLDAENFERMINSGTKKEDLTFLLLRPKSLYLERRI